MPGSSSSERSELEQEQETLVSPMSSFTPITTASSSDALGIDAPKESKKSRRDSNVRFRDISPLPIKHSQDPALPLYKDRYTSQSGREDWAKSSLQPQPYSELLEERTRLEGRISMLEARLENLDVPRIADFSDKGDGSSERSAGLSLEPQWQTWQEYLETPAKATNILEVLTEKPHTNKKSSLAIAQPETAPEDPNPVKNIERIRFRSVHIINALQQITEQTFPNASCFTIHRPFKILLFYEDAIEDHLTELEHEFSRNAHCILGEQCKAHLDLEKIVSMISEDNISSQERAQRAMRNGADDRSDYDYVAGADLNGRKPLEGQFCTSNAVTGQQLVHSARDDDVECKHEMSEDLLAQGEALSHLRALSKFMKEDMREIFKRHHLLRSPRADEVSFTDIWHLFMAGDLVVTNDESNQMIYRVSILPAGSPFSSRRPVKEMKLRSDGSHQQFESIYGQEAMSVLHIDVFYYNFDGRNFGPVEERLTVVSYDGMKKVTDLPVYPLRFREDSHQYMKKMLGRGKKFRELLTKPHWEYNGLSAAEPQEQVRSQRKSPGATSAYTD